MRKFLRKLFRFLFILIIWFFSLSVASVILFRFAPVPITPLMIIRCADQLFSGETIKLKKDWVRLKNISPSLPRAVIAAEDQNFENHFGFDFDAIRKAQVSNKRNPGVRLKGASTISQQTAKNVFLWPSRSWVRKGFEVYFTLLIEIFWSKRRIMEVYLNVIETGNGIYGVEAASECHFKKSSSKLTLKESALLAAVLPNPRRWSPASPSPYIQRKSQRIIQNIRRISLIDF